ncbi:hypothetical protein Ddye_009397 [Dipteronia dyeriana]|uniref:Subtilisin-like protease fibronectin type-III domain-containing protein n=1 Tax=Dipteronia dyeriana TaxID=168575 RepID=A0AAD9XBJ4_9ROSI|nr:hypothetical protein Ddye_009397 [Dipteronia dyeriana]
MGYNNAYISNLTWTRIICLENNHHHGGLNLNPILRKKVTVTRKVTNVGHMHTNSMYKAVVKAPYSLKLRVEASSFEIQHNHPPVIYFKVSFFLTQRMFKEITYSGA